MPRKILIAAFEAPGYGGASTVAYRLFEDLQQQGFAVSFLSILAPDDAAYLRVVLGATLGNPRGLADVHTVVLDREPLYPSAVHARLVRSIEALAPDLMLGIDFIATLLLKSAAPDLRIIFLTAGCNQAKLALLEGRAHSVVDILAAAGRQRASTRFRLPPRTAVRESQAVAGADLILVHSEMMRALYEHYFPAHASKLFPETLWLAEWICQEAAPFRPLRKAFAARAIDVLFVASRWQRPEKNWALARELILRHPELNIHVVGESEQRPGHATYHGLVTDRAVLFGMMADARVVVSTSRLDAAPGVLFEAAAMGCNIVASRNCGNWELCHAALLADSLRAEDFSHRIRAACSREYAQDLERFLRPSARQLLADILEVF